MKKLFEFLFNALGKLLCLALMTLIAAAAHIYVSAAAGGVPQMFNTSFFIVQNQSGRVDGGDFVLIDQTRKDLAKGDLVAAKTSFGFVLGTVKKQNPKNGAFVIEIENFSGKTVRTVQGKNILGKMSGKIKALGAVCRAFSDYGLPIIILGGGALCFALLNLLKNEKAEFLD
jgi:translation initiation factor IF-1